MKFKKKLSEFFEVTLVYVQTISYVYIYVYAMLLINK